MFLWDLSTKSFNVKFRALVSAQIVCMEIFLMLGLQFFALWTSFLENGMEEEFWKNSKCSSNYDLLIKQFNVEFSAQANA